MMSPVIFYTLILGVVEVLQYFLVPLVLKNGTGEPGGATLFYNLYLYKTFFTFQNMSYGATLAWFLFGISRGGGGQASGPSRATASSSSAASLASSFAQARCFVPNSRSRSSRPSVEPHQHPRGPVFRRGAFVEHAQPAGGHQVDQQSQVAELNDRHLADPAHPAHLRAAPALPAAGRRSSSRSSPAPATDSTRRSGRARVQAARGDLDLRQLGHPDR